MNKITMDMPEFNLGLESLAKHPDIVKQLVSYRKKSKIPSAEVIPVPKDNLVMALNILTNSDPNCLGSYITKEGKEICLRDELISLLS